MTPHGKAQHVAHDTDTPQNRDAVRRRTPVEGSVYDNWTAKGTADCRFFGRCDRGSLAAARTRIASPSEAMQPKRDARGLPSPHPITGVPITASSINSTAAAPARYTSARISLPMLSACLLQSRSPSSRRKVASAGLAGSVAVSVASLGVCQSWANHRGGGVACRAASGEQVFPAVHHKIETALPSLPVRCGRARRLRSWRFARRSRSALQSSGYPGSANRPLMRLWSCLTNYGRASGLDEYCCGPLAVSPATKHSPTRMPDYRGDQNSPGYAAVNADQLGCEGNRLPGRSGRNEGPWAAVGVTAGETALNSRAPSHQKRWRDASGGLPRTDPETSTSPGCRMGGVARNRDVTGRRDAHPVLKSPNRKGSASPVGHPALEDAAS